MKNSKNKIIMILSVAALLLVSTLKTEAQKKAEFGVRLMPTFSSFDMKTSTGGTVKGKVTLGFGFGAFLGFSLTNHVAIQGEFIYSSTSQTIKENAVEHKIGLKYVNVPLLLSLNTGKSKMVNFNVVAGPQLGFNAGSSIHTSGSDGVNTSTAVLSVKKGDLGLAYGAGLDFGLNTAKTFRLGVGFRGVIGLIDISDNSKTTATNSYYILDRTHIVSNSAYIGASILF